MSYTAIHSEGALIPEEILDQIAREELPGQKAADFGLPKDTRLGDEIARAWSDAQDYWRIFTRHAQELPKGETGATLTRERWMAPLLNYLLGYELTYQAAGAVVGGQTFPVSHRAGPGADWPPVHIGGFREDLDRRPESGRRRLSPQALIQEYLNRTDDHLWGIVTNGYVLRLLRQSTRASRPSYLEFDLQNILDGQRYTEFALFFRLCHRTRLPRPSTDPHKCLLEEYFQKSIEQGGRVREHLREGVEEALKIFGTGFLRHPVNRELAEQLQKGTAPVAEFHRQLLRLVYRLLFLMVAEERKMILPEGPEADRRRRIYEHYYSIARLRTLAERVLEEAPYEDLWLGLKQTFRLFNDVPGSNPLSIPPLNGELFSSRATPLLDGTHVYNHDLLRAMRHLSLFVHDKVRQRINYAALDVEELGSVYESLLDYQPKLKADIWRWAADSEKAAAEPALSAPRSFPMGAEYLSFDLASGTERKSTGSYYTRPELVAELIESALVPVLEERVKKAATREDKEHAILGMKVCDPASGSGHFLLAAARRMGRELSKVRTGEEEPTPKEFHLAVRDVIAHCLYAVDKNPLAVDLCKVALWLEGHWTGKPLSFLDHRVKCGDSLIGVFDPAALKVGIPDEAFNPVTGDDKKAAPAIKKRNKQERERPQRLLPFDHTPLGRLEDLARQFAELGEVVENTPADVKRKAELYAQIHESPNAHQAHRAANLWTAAFFVSLSDPQHPLVPTTERLWEYMERPGAAYAPMIGVADSQAMIHRFFHWPLEFPEVFAQGGFDVVLGNPPWERIKLQEEEFFSTRDSSIAKAAKKADRQALIDALPKTNPSLALTFQQAKHESEGEGKFVRGSGRFSLTGHGDVNTYAAFAELSSQLLDNTGRAGILVPVNIATDDSTKAFFGSLTKSHTLVRILGFENEAFIFPAVHHAFKFCALTLSGADSRCERARLSFFCRKFEHARDPLRSFELSGDDFALLSPNTLTCPTFRTRADADLTKKLCRAAPPLINENSGTNPWGARYVRLIHLADHAEHIRFFWEEIGAGFIGLYEAKLICNYDHRFATFAHVAHEDAVQGYPREVSRDEKLDPTSSIQTRYVVDRDVAEALFAKYPEYSKPWFLVWRDITNATNERTTVAAAIPRVPATVSSPVLGFNTKLNGAVLLGNLNSLPLDFAARQKTSGMHLNFMVFKQLPILRPNFYTAHDLVFICPRVLEMVYTAWDLNGFVVDLWACSDQQLRHTLRCAWEDSKTATGGHELDPPELMEIAGDGVPLAPFKWDEGRRARLRAELDAYYALLYGLNRKQLRYILDPADLTRKEIEDILDPWEEVTDPLDPEGYRRRAEESDFPGETFRVLKQKELKLYGEYRTRRLVLEAFERLAPGFHSIGQQAATEKVAEEARNGH